MFVRLPVLVIAAKPFGAPALGRFHECEMVR
jgi:hypothetical protein